MIHLITPKVKGEIIKVTTFLSEQFRDKNKTDLIAICADEGIKTSVDEYGKYFDRMLVWDGKNFNIHLNTSKGNTLDTTRGRFTLSHELGHYFLEAHNYAIKNGDINHIRLIFHCFIKRKWRSKLTILHLAF